MTPVRVVDRGVRPPGAGLDDIIHVVGMQPDLQDRHFGVVLQGPLQPVVEGARRLVGGEKGAGEADAGNGGARGDRHLGVGVDGEVRAAQAIEASVAPSAHGSPRLPWPSRPRWPTKASGLKCKGTKVKPRCWNPCWHPLLEPLSALEPYAGTPCWNPLSALEPLLEPLLEPPFFALEPLLEPVLEPPFPR